MIVVVDAAVVVAALVDNGPTGQWSELQLMTEELAAPHLMPVETANILRRSAMAGDISADVASIAHEDLLALNVELFTYQPFGARVWQFRNNMTAYDAWYVAIAESLNAPLATLDMRLSRASGSGCTFLTPPDLQAI